MAPKFSALKRIEILEKVLKQGESVSKICQEYGISRTLFYRWKARYQKAHPEEKLAALKPKPPELKKRHPRRIPRHLEEMVLKMTFKNPKYSTRKISLRLPKNEEGKPAVGNHGVQNILKRNGLNTHEKRLAFAKAPKKVLPRVKIELPKEPPVKLSPQDRLEMIEKVVKEGAAAADVCQHYGISRTIFYRLKKRYDQAPEGKKALALTDKEPEIERYWHQAPEKYEEAVLKVVADYPELSSRKIVGYLPKIGKKPILSNHGVQNVLRRHDLNTYAKRLEYSEAQIHIAPGFVEKAISGFQQLFTGLLGKPAPARQTLIRNISVAAFAAFFLVIIFGLKAYLSYLFATPYASRLGLIFASTSLSMGSFFFLYSLKYYLSLALVLSFSRQTEEMFESGPEPMATDKSVFSRIFTLANGNGLVQKISNHKKGLLGLIFNNGLINGKNNQKVGLAPSGVGLGPGFKGIKLKRKPFVSIHLPFYNEKRVADRILSACAAIDYPNFEVIVCDDSTDETTDICEDWGRKDKRIRVIHRETREGFKGGALKYAVEQMDERTEFVIVFDADFVPYPDTIEMFVKYFKANNQGSEDYGKTNVAVIGGYQWHVLNKSENWITRGVRTEYAGSYVIERAAQELTGGLKQISGSVYMIRADVLKELGWGTSITEDFELTLKLYEKGYKVVYTPYIQAPAECVSTMKRLIRQRMRWAEGHSNNVKKMFFRLLKSTHLTVMEKVEFLYICPYYLQAAFFLVGTFCWLLAEAVFRARLPFWTSLWGWSLVLTNMLSLPLMNAVGLFLEEGEKRDYLGLLSFVAISYLVVPFQAYAAVKGLLEAEEGTWFRTPKTGKITDIFTRGRFYRFLTGIFPWRPAPRLAFSLNPNPYTLNPRLNPYLALATANSSFENFSIKPKRIRWVSKAVLAILLVFSVTILSLSQGVREVQANNWTNLYTRATTTHCTGKKDVETTAGTAGAQIIFQAVGEETCWYSEILPTNSGDANMGAGPWSFHFHGSWGGGTTGDSLTIAAQVALVDDTSCGSPSSEDSGSVTYTKNTIFPTTHSIILTNLANTVITAADPKRIQVCLHVTAEAKTGLVYFNYDSATNDSYLAPNTLTIPERLVLLLIVMAPFIPMIVLWMKKRREDTKILGY